MKRIIFFLFVVAVFASCSKYEEGPLVSPYSRKARVANTWTISYAKANNETTTDDYSQYELQLGRDGDAEIDAEFTFFGSEYKANTDGTWQLTNDDELLELNFENDEFDKTYQILKLTEHEMRLREQGEDVELWLEGQ